VPQLRQNIVTGDWVVIAPERAKRPDDFVTADTVKHQSRTNCVFCDSKEPYKTSIKKYETKNIYLTPNKYPAFVENLKKCSSRSYKIENEFYRMRDSLGGHDVVVVKDHDKDLPRFTRPIWVDMLNCFKKRYVYFDEHCSNVYTMAIYNHGSQAGQSIEHPHAQIFSSNIIPNIISREIYHTERFYETNGECIFCKILEHEKKEKIRIVYENKSFLAFTVFAARFPFETWVYPKIHRSRFENITSTEVHDLANCLISVFGKLDKALNDPPLNFFIHSLPNTIVETDYYHWHLEIAPRITKYGGYEMGSGNIIDIVSPEKSAEYLKDISIKE